MPMKFDCPKCNKPYKLNDDFAPPESRIVFPCRRCGHEIILDFGNNISGSKKTVSDFSIGNTDLEGHHEALPDKQIEKIISHAKRIKPLPNVVLKARKLLNDEDATLSDISNLIETDPAMAARVLRFANSAYYGMQGKVASLKHAAHILGFAQIAQMFQILGSMEVLGSRLKGYDFDAMLLWKHSLFTASAAGQIAETVNPAIEQEAFTSGLIHDVGKIVLDPFIIQHKDLFERKKTGKKISMLQLEREILGIDHAQAGYAVCRIWHLPAVLSSAILHHHSPENDKNSPTLSTILAIANMLAAKSGIGLDNEHESVNPELLDAIGLDISDMMRIGSDALAFVEEATETVTS